MATDAPYFKFRVSEYNDGDITLCSFASQGLFINLCSLYWSKECKLSMTKAERKFNAPKELWDELIKDGIFKVDSKGNISISFLNEQLEEFKAVSKKNSKNGSKRWNKDGTLSQTAAKPDAKVIPNGMPNLCQPSSQNTTLALPKTSNIEKKRKDITPDRGVISDLLSVSNDQERTLGPESPATVLVLELEKVTEKFYDEAIRLSKVTGIDGRLKAETFFLALPDDKKIKTMNWDWSKIETFEKMNEWFLNLATE